MPRRVLISGGAGFIGSHLVDAHLALGDSVTVLDDLSTGFRTNLDPRADLVVESVQSARAAELISNGNFDLINLHAAQADVRVSVDDPRRDASTNLMGLMNVMEAARKCSRRPRIVFVSSGGVVYGTPKQLPTPETHAKGPESPYGVSKLAGEQYLFYYHTIHGFDVVALRYSNVYGPRQNPHGEAGVVAIFSSRLIKESPLTIYGDGKQTRDYVYVADCVSANLIAAEVTLGKVDSIDDFAFNVGTGVETSVLELANTLGTASKRKVVIDHGAARAGELLASCLDTSRLKSHGWAPSVTLEQGLRQTYQHIASGGE